eukprot:CAMPEP_0171466868 /NCGR_PEP_ID=MMETSP0945-20130129/9570_1 /TAXON_ID=109269 /ORGANISM="Vaucheria litorea, Strain CCMP2940" /LENGTH=151 /DNA_ID=CAMNT_0011995153 /DNA_START=29 /DNA_END=481 /DNA_ORIENTATION=+
MKKFTRNLGKTIQRLVPGNNTQQSDVSVSMNSVSSHNLRPMSMDQMPSNVPSVSLQSSEENASLPMSVAPNKRAAIHNDPDEFAGYSKDSLLDEGLTPVVAYKTPETSSLLLTALREHFLFAQLDERELRECLDRMDRREYKVGENLITQG